MAIIISENGKNAKRLDESSFALEDNLQQYIYDNPDAIPLYDIDQDTKLFIAAREFSTKSGPIDALGFDANGNIYVVETKLYKNPDKRNVLAQVLDYGASLWRHSTDYENFESQLDSHCNKQFQQTFKEKYAEFFALEDATESIQSIRTNLSEGIIKFVVLMDTLHEALKDLVLFVNQNSKFDIYAVELEYYKHKSFEIIIPKLFGTEVKKDVKSSRYSSDYMTQSDEDSFWEYAEKNVNDGVLSEYALTVTKELVELYKNITKQAGGYCSYWRAKTDLQDVMKIIFNDSNNKVAFSINSDSSIGAWVGDKTGLQIDFIQTVLNELITHNMLGKQDRHLNYSRWFVDIKKSTANDNDVRKFLDINRKVYAQISNSK
jgi:hypothetical protein